MSKVKEKAPTAKELKEMQDRKDKFYDENLPFLRKMAEYEKLNHDVAYYRLNRRMLAIKEAELSAPEPETPQTNKK